MNAQQLKTNEQKNGSEIASEKIEKKVKDIPWFVKSFAEQINWMQSEYLDETFEKKNRILWKMDENDSRTVINNTVNDVNHDKTIIAFSEGILSCGKGFIKEILEYIHTDIWKLGSTISCRGGTYKSLDMIEAEIKDGLLKDLLEKKKEAERLQQQQEKETKKRKRVLEESEEKERNKKKMKAGREALLQKLEKKTKDNDGLELRENSGYRSPSSFMRSELGIDEIIKKKAEKDES